MTITPTLADINAARARLAGRIHVTPLVHSRTLADRAGCAEFVLKCESLQKTGSFKVRGALNAISQLDAAARARGVVTVSAGNHAQAVAWAARAEGVKATVVMPKTASETKATASAGYGAEVIRHGTGAEAFVRAQELADTKQLAFVHPFENPHVLAGAATTGIEILEQEPDVDVIVVPIGGGGLIGGISAAVKQLKPSVRIFGVEPEGAAVMRQSLDAGKAVRMATPPNTIADGLAAPMAGEHCYELVRDLVDDVVIVTDQEIGSALSFLLARTKLLAEPAGAAATAALLEHKIPGIANKRVVAILSGGNIDLDRLKALV